MRHHQQRMAVCMVVVLHMMSCFASYSWDINALPCESNSNGDALCLSGYSCLVQNNTCIADHSLDLNDTCYVDRQCPIDMLCPLELFSCSEGCASTTGFYEPNMCNGTDYCAPFYSSLSVNHLVATCVASNHCTTDATCTTGICVQISNGSTSCQPPCHITWISPKQETDNCGIAGYCQPIGEVLPTNKQRLVCLSKVQSAPLAIGAACGNPVIAPCMAGSMCIDDICRVLCQLNSGNSTCTQLQTCTKIPLDSQEAPVGYCKPI